MGDNKKSFFGGNDETFQSKKKGLVRNIMDVESSWTEDQIKDALEKDDKSTLAKHMKGKSTRDKLVTLDQEDSIDDLRGEVAFLKKRVRKHNNLLKWAGGVVSTLSVLWILFAFVFPYFFGAAKTAAKASFCKQVIECPASFGPKPRKTKP